ncbi:MAG: hypothetical protein J6P38_07700 [Acetobacter sp.]|nr:hypothetical protein [Acetobacter sp.]
MPHSSQKHSSEEETFPFISPKLLLTLVVGMGILIILGIAVLIGVIIHRLNTPHSPNHAALSSFASHSCFPEAYQRHTPPPILLTLTKEEHIAHITPVGTCVLALHIIDHHNEKIFLWDIPHRRIIIGATLSVIPSVTHYQAPTPNSSLTPILTPPLK